MCFRHPGKPTKTKKTIYLFLSTILGLLLSVIAYGLVEIDYLNRAAANGKIVQFHNGGALLPAIQIGVLAAGAIGGFLIGRIWWQMLYVDRVREKRNKKSSSPGNID